MTTLPFPEPAPEPPFATVAVPVPVAGPFAYSVPAALVRSVAAGSRVLVPFGGRQLVATVLATHDELPDDLDPQAVKAIRDVIDREAAVQPSVLGVCRRVADRTLTHWGEVLQLALPPAGRRHAGRRVRRRPREAPTVAAELSDRARTVLEVLTRGSDDEAHWMRLVDLERRVGDAELYGACVELWSAGLVELDDEWTRRSRTVMRRGVRRARAVDRSAALDATGRAPAQRRVVEVLWRHRSDRSIDARALAAEAETTSATLRALEAKGLIRIDAERVVEETPPTLPPSGAGTFELTGAQASALAAIDRALSSEQPRPLLLHGVTGSGKTEVYLRAAASVVERGRTALLLVPEIGLTPQLEQRAREVLGDRVALFHSGLSTGRRQDSWWRARRGDATVVVGPRSAVFAPLVNVGLIVVDEEQDGAYKQEERPRYHGRDVAILRAEAEGAVVVLGSATPAVETFRLARSGAVTLATLPERVARRPLPRMELVDMREEWRGRGNTLVSARLRDAVEQRLERGEQALVLLNRRGFASALICRACGERVECPDCSVTLTLHRRDRALRCHYCDYRIGVLVCCPACGARELNDAGIGTERLQAALAKRFPRARIGRFDADETRRRGAHARILGAFGRGEIDVLVGTQMLAKGHDFPRVTLVGVVGADASLMVPDFRAAERTFQLLTQMAGRAGRGDVPGEVLLQAHQPGHYAIRSAMAHDYESFYEQEIEFRRRLLYPPFCALATLVCRSKELLTAQEDSQRLARAIREAARTEIRVLGPAQPPIARLRGRFRVQVMVKARRRSELLAAVAGATSTLRRANTLPRDLVIDVDPVSVM